MDNVITNAKVTVSDNGMSAYILIPPPNTPDVKYTATQIIETLHHAGITTGIMSDAIADFLASSEYNRPVPIAQGIPAVNGVDGFFTYHFKTTLDNKPKELPDGSVDYRSIDLYEPVTAGSVIATYTPAVPGINGVTVKGTVVNAMPGKEQKPLKGTGFSISEDLTTYTSQLNGKIEFNCDTITITNVMEIKSDVDIASGDIVFDGDVIIHGNVLSGSMIHAGGELTILGNVEGAYIFSDGNMQIKGGMQGSGKGVVECNSDVWGKFFEQSTLRIKGDLHSNSLLNCNAYVMKNIYITGKRGIIVGGDTVSIGSIEATIVGNAAEAKTKLSAGMTDVMMHEVGTLEKRVLETKENLSKLKQVLSQMNSMENVDKEPKLIAMRKRIIVSIKILEDQLSESSASLDYNLSAISEYSTPRIVVRKFLYPGTGIMLNGIHLTVNDTYTNVCLKTSEGAIQIINNV